MIWLSMFTYGCCDGRRHYGELAGRIMGVTERIRGGVDYTVMRATREEERSEALMRVEGYTPTKGMHGDTVMWTYTCQSATDARIRAWSGELRGAFVALQSTARTYCPDLGEKRLQQWVIEAHDVFETRVRKRPREATNRRAAQFLRRGV